MKRTIIAAVAFGALAANGCSVDTVDGDPVIIEGVGTYDPCSFDDQCPIDTDCVDVEIDYGDVIVTDAMCTVACGSDFDCPGDGLCFEAATGPALCYEPCFDDLDCPVDFGCVQDVDLFAFEPVCMPI